jgi:peptidoglycan/LPS O-acetylase OafA/YrhL
MDALLKTAPFDVDVATERRRGAPPNSLSAALSYNSRLDTLRAFAAIAVLAFHYSAWFGWGWIGVPFFFVLSGYLITSILLESKDRTPTFGRFCADFLRRRVLRLVPVYALFLLVCVAYSLWTHNAGTLRSDLPYLLTYTFNFESMDHIDRLYGHLWSLSVEWQFYLFWPVAVWLFSGRALQRILIAIVCLAPLLRLVSFHWFRLHHAPPSDAGQWVYLLSWTHFDALAIGALLAWEDAIEFLSSKRVLVTGAAVVLLAGVLVSALEWYRGYAGANEELVSLGYPFGFYRFREHVWGYSLLDVFFGAVVARAASSKSLAGIFRWRWLAYLGKVSYGFYLFHYPVILITVYLLARLAKDFEGPLIGPAWQMLAPSLGFVLSVALTFLVAHLSYQSWERRFLKMIPRRERVHAST